MAQASKEESLGLSCKSRSGNDFSTENIETNPQSSGTFFGGKKTWKTGNLIRMFRSLLNIINSSLMAFKGIWEDLEIFLLIEFIMCKFSAERSLGDVGAKVLSVDLRLLCSWRRLKCDYYRAQDVVHFLLFNVCVRGSHFSVTLAFSSSQSVSSALSPARPVVQPCVYPSHLIPIWFTVSLWYLLMSYVSCSHTHRAQHQPSTYINYHYFSPDSLLAVILSFIPLVWHYYGLTGGLEGSPQGSLFRGFREIFKKLFHL